MKIATFNANSIRARLEVVIDWLDTHEPDVLAIQETKVQDDQFPLDTFEDAGWNAVIHGQKSYNGVAILSRHPIRTIQMGMNDPLWPEDCRILIAEVLGLPIINTYVPNGTKVGSEKFDYKLKWLPRFGQVVSSLFKPNESVVWLGDINIAPTEKDLFDPVKFRGGVGFHPDEIAALEALLGWGWTDCFRQFNAEAGQFTFWEFVIPRAFERNLGWRIDHIYATEPLLKSLTSCVVDREPRGGERPSDHTFVVAEL